jgi:hypothetical protein
MLLLACAVAAAPADAAARNVVRYAAGVYLPAYPVKGSTTTSVAFGLWSGLLSAFDEAGTLLWSTSTSATTWGGGFDFDADGWPDVVVAVSADTGKFCGAQPIKTSKLKFYSGRTGVAYVPLTPLEDKCWSFPGTPSYATPQYAPLSVLWGDETSRLLVSPYYATVSTFLTFANGFTVASQLHYPSTSQYDLAYTADQLNAWGTGTAYIANSHIANGLLTGVGAGIRAVFFTSGRVVQYRIGAFSATQLAADRPYVTGGRTDLAGRNYGLVAVDPGAPAKVVLLAGTSNYSLASDMRTGTRSEDVWGGIERHVSIYDTTANTVDDRFYSYAHDAGDAHQYEGRVSYPANPFVRRSGPSRIAYNVYEGGRWNLHVSQPGSTADQWSLKDVFLWDIADVDHDGVDDWVISPARYPNEPDVPGYYFTKWVTSLDHWDEANQTLRSFQTHNDVIPYLQPHFTKANKTSSNGWLAPVQRFRNLAGKSKVLMLNSSRAVVARLVSG